MSDVTIKELALKMGMPGDKLLTQLKAAGMKFSDQEQVISSTEKVKLLGFLRRNKNQDADAAAGEGTPRHVTLRRRTVGELKVATPGPRGAPTTAKTVNVEVRGKRTYVKRSVIAEAANAEPEREDAVRKLEESRLRQEQEVADSARAAERRQQEAEQRNADEAQAAAAAQLPAADTGSTPVFGEAPAAPEVPVAQELAAEPDGGDAQGTVQRIDPRDLGMIIPQIQAPHKRQRVVKPVAKPAAETTTRAAPSPPPPPPTDAGSGHAKVGRHVRERAEGTGGRDGRGAKRFGGGQMHLSEADRARRSSGSKRSRVVRPGRDLSRSGASATAAHAFSRPTAPVVREVTVSDTNTVSDLAQKMAVKGAEVVKALFKMGVMATINQSIDHDTAVLVVEELGHKPVTDTHNDAEQTLAEHTQTAELEGEKSPRPPVVTIMGHVDHGKTSLLDYIRRTKVASGEAGGITQHIGAYHVQTSKGGITFIDTPGHAAFSAMRARGAQSTDIVVLVVAADDGVMPQTIEAVNHARAAKVPLIVAVNKMDKEGANPDNVKQGLVQHEVVPEDWGGDVQFVPVSAKTGAGVDDLLDAISVQAEIMDLQAVVDGRATGVVIESSLDRGRGPVATVLVQQGTLKKGDYVVCGVEYGRMRALINANGKQEAAAGPSIPVQVLGLSGVPETGDDFVSVDDEHLARQVAAERQQKRRETRMVSSGNRLEDIIAKMGQGDEQQTLNILIKGDVQGSVEALRDSLTQIGNERVRVNVVSSGVGGISESDATLAAASKALLIGFNVRADASARKVIESSGVDVRYFSIIYDVIDQVTQAATGLLGMEVREDIIGVAEVREVFRSSKFGAVAGSRVIEGTVKRNKPIRVLRDQVVIFEGELESLRRFKELVDEVSNGMECGIAVKQYDDVKVGDQIECFERTEVARTL
ncbi:MAG TPA: translation initiation factor IF-2 [Rhodanobacter sp.]|nr:translation initiation factor IF-2 [Rhodanobacter sp.]